MSSDVIKESTSTLNFVNRCSFELTILRLEK